MRAVEIRVRPEELAARMAAMRSWLDLHRMEPASFGCRRTGADMLIRAIFNGDDQARAFQTRFSPAC